ADPQYAGPATAQRTAATTSSGSERSALAVLGPQARFSRGGGKLTALPFSGWESSWVADVFGKVGINVNKFVKADATEAKLRENISGRAVIHLACHGLVDQQFGN